MTAGRPGRWGTVLLAAALAVEMTACTGASAPSGGNTTRTEITTVGTRPPSPAAFTPAAPSSRHPLRPGADARSGEKNGACPYIKTGLDQTSGSGVNVADIEGDRIYRTTRLTSLTPVGCRFYFYAPPYEAVAEIHPQTLANAATARNAMILTARTGTEILVERDFADGLDGIAFRTRFFGEDEARDWAFAFAKGRVLVIVYTQRKDTSRNAIYLAKAIAGKF